MKAVLAATTCLGLSSAFTGLPGRAAPRAGKGVVFAEEDGEAAAAPAAAPKAAAAAPAGGGFALGDLQALAAEQNPVVQYFDPLGLSEMEFFDESNAATIGFLRVAPRPRARACFLSRRAIHLPRRTRQSFMPRPS